MEIFQSSSEPTVTSGTAALAQRIDELNKLEVELVQTIQQLTSQLFNQLTGNVDRRTIRRTGMNVDQLSHELSKIEEFRVNSAAAISKLILNIGISVDAADS